MITKEEAFRLAKKWKPGFDGCQEFTNAYLFTKKSEESNIGGEGPLVILKETGRWVPLTTYYDEYGGEFVRTLL